MDGPETATLEPGHGGVPAGGGAPCFQPQEIVAGRFRIVRLLGQGGMAQVFEAEDPVLGQRVALKVIRPELAASRRARELLRREALLARRVTHPNVCRIFDVFQHGGAAGGGEAGRGSPRLVLVMELLGGETLARHLAGRGPLSPAAALPIVAQLADALEAAHRSQVVHGDFKCGNVMLEPAAHGTRAVVTDFGLAQQPLADGCCAGGTAAYMAPELLRGGAATPASDLYALGVVVHEMVVGQRPRTAGRLPARARRPAVPSGPRGAPRLLPTAWKAVLRRCLAGAPGDRPASAQEVARALAAGLPRAPGRPGLEVARQRLGRIGAMALLAGCLGLVAPAQRPARPAPRAAAAVAGRAPWQAEAPRLVVAVGELADLSAPPAAAWLPAALSRRVLLELAAGGQVEAFQLPATAARGAAGEPPGGGAGGGTRAGGGRSGTAPRRGGGALGVVADFVASGSIELSREGSDPALQVAVELWRPGAARAVAELREAGRRSQAGALAERLGARLREVIGAGAARPPERAATVQLHAQTLEAEGLYAQGLALLLGGRLTTSFQTLRLALAADPGFPLAHAAAARACAGLGFDRQARLEALTATRLALPLPQRQRLEIAAISRRVHGDLQGAAGLFRALWRFAPHDPDNGIQLADSQIESGRPGEALDTVRLLRAQGCDAERAPVLGVLEARALLRRSDDRAALAAALAAADAARRTGNEAVLAAAGVEEAAAREGAGEYGGAARALAQAGDLFRRLAWRGGEAEVLRRSGNLAMRQGETVKALALYSRALAAFHAIGALHGAALTLADTGDAELIRGSAARAAPLLERARAELHGLGDRAGEANAVNGLALAAIDRHQAALAEELFADAMSLESQAGNRRELAGVLLNLSALERTRGELDGARQHEEEALRLLRQLGIQGDEALAHTSLGITFAMSGDLRRAESELLAALGLARQANWPYAEVNALSGLGAIQVQQGRFAAAESTLRQGLAPGKDGADQGVTANLLANLAHLEILEARFVEAGAAVRRVLQLDRDAGAPLDACMLALLAAAQAGTGDAAAARQTIARALALPPAAGDAAANLAVALGAARVALAAGRPADARRRLEVALARPGSAHRPDIVFEARLLLGMAERDAGQLAAACSGLRLLATQAAAAGFAFVAREADRLLGGCAASGGPASGGPAPAPDRALAAAGSAPAGVRK